MIRDKYWSMSMGVEVEEMMKGKWVGGESKSETLVLPGTVNETPEQVSRVLYIAVIMDHIIHNRYFVILSNQNTR